MKLYLADDIYDFQSRPTPRPTFILSLPKFEPSPSSIPPPPSSIPVSPRPVFFFLQGKDNPRISSKYNEKDVTTKRGRVIFSIRAKFFQIVEYFRYSIRFDDRNNRWNGQFSLISGRGDGRSKRWEKSDGILRFHRGNEYA